MRSVACARQLSRAALVAASACAAAPAYRKQRARLPVRCDPVPVARNDAAPATASSISIAAVTDRWRPFWQFEQDYTLHLDRELGCGGSATVYLAVHKTGVSRAVKRVRRDDEKADRALQQEFLVMQRLQDCAHVVRVIDAFVDETYRYMVMEMCYGLDLVGSMLEEFGGASASDQDSGAAGGHPNVPHVAAVFREMVTAVAECHANNVSHMDIKPDNFVHMSTRSVSNGVRVKLLDFGLAWSSVDDACVSVQSRLGCSKYLAPELFAAQVRGRRVAPAPCDMYALGVSLFNLLTGKFPYEFYRVGRPRSSPDLELIEDPAAQELVGQLLALDPTERPTAAEVLCHDFLVAHADADVVPLAELKDDASGKSLFLGEDAQRIQRPHCDGSMIVPRTVVRGEVLFHEGDRSRNAYYVTDGSFDITRNGAVLEKIHAESIIGEMGALFDYPRNATVIAAEDSQVLVLQDACEKLGNTQQQYALKRLQETALKGFRRDKMLDFLKSSTLFRDANEELLNMVVTGSDLAFCGSGETLGKPESDAKSALYIVLEGLLEMRGTSGHVAFFGLGDLVGEIALVFGQGCQRCHQACRCASVKALRPTTLLVLEGSSVARILRSCPKERAMIQAMAESRVTEMGLRPVAVAL